MFEVTQSARDAAAKIVHEQMKGSMDWFHANDHRDRITSGNWDNHPLVQAFAAAEHRAHIAGMREAAGVSGKSFRDMAGADHDR